MLSPCQHSANLTVRSLFLKSLSRLHVLNIAWPIILSNISTPLLGLVDTAVIGNLGSASLLGGIALGGVIFSFLFWGFGFLRMGTTALTAQAVGADDYREAFSGFIRAASIGVSIGLIFILFSGWLGNLSLAILGGSEPVETAAKQYFDIRILGAPFSLTMLAVMGYLLGLQETRSVLMLNLLLNGLNIALDLIFVLGFDWGVEGVALATVCAEFTALVAGLYLIYKMTPKTARTTRREVFDLDKMTRMFKVNRDIMTRTLCLIFAFAWFTDQGAGQGDITLAANAILMQFVTFAAFFLDGFALASETLIGAATGAGIQTEINLAIRYVFELGSLTALLTSTSFWLLGPSVVDFLTNVPEVRLEAREYLIWAISAPIVSVWCYLLDGIFIGATRTVEMRNAMIASLLFYLGVWYLAVPEFGNHGLWLALHSYFVARAISLLYYLPSVQRNVD